MKTAERIRQAALALFNSQGEPNTSTNHIADELDISPGNLYYHFRSKESIVGDLFARFAARMDEILGPPPADRELDMEDMWLYLHVLFEIIHEYRFIYRDLSNLLGRYPTLAKAFPALLARQEATAFEICYQLAANGDMTASKREVALVAEQIVFTLTYWLSHAQIRHSDRSEPEQLALGIQQVLSLVAPYLDAPARRLLADLSRSYLHEDKR